MARQGPEELARLSVRMAAGPEDIAAAQRLRYQVFVRELGAGGPFADHQTSREADRFDPFADHLLLIDSARRADDQVVGVYRVMTQEMAKAAGQFYCEDEYDLSPLHNSGHRLLELGRSCLHRDYRGGAGMLHLWGGLADYVEAHDIGVMFGVASFHGTDAGALAQPLSLLHHRHLAPPHLRVTAKGPQAHRMDLIAEADIDRLAAVRAMPALIKAYLRLGGTVGSGAFVDHDFNTTDICLILEKSAISALGKAIYTKAGARG